MRVMLSSIGSRGDVQPSLALALQLRSIGHEVILCVAPNFKPWVESFGICCVPCGTDTREALQRFAATNASAQPIHSVRTSLAFLRDELKNQFEVLSHAAKGCDLIVGSGLQAAGGSIAELLKIPYIYAAFCPTAIPSERHPPPWARLFSVSPWLNRLQWQINERGLNFAMREAFNAQRACFGLSPVNSVWRFFLTDRPWLAADPLLAPIDRALEKQTTQTGAWFLPDPNLLPEALEKFLAAGEPPIYFGFGSITAVTPEIISRHIVTASRSVGRRAIISQGWARLDAIDAGCDCISIGAVAHEKLFTRVAAVVHHGGAGTTAAAARAGKPQVVVPHVLDQYYWAHRVQQLGIGPAHIDHSGFNAVALTHALRACLRPEIRRQASKYAAHIKIDGACIAAERMTAVG